MLKGFCAAWWVVQHMYCNVNDVPLVSIIIVVFVSYKIGDKTCFAAYFAGGLPVESLFHCCRGGEGCYQVELTLASERIQGVRIHRCSKRCLDRLKMRQGGLDGRCWSGALPGARSALPGVVSPCVSIRSLCGKHNRQYGVQGGGVSRGQRLITGSYIGNGAQKPGTPFMGQDDFELDVTSGPLPDSLRIEEEIGRGTFGVVHRAVNERSGDNVAVKLLRKQSGPFVNLGRIRNEVGDCWLMHIQVGMLQFTRGVHSIGACLCWVDANIFWSVTHQPSDLG